jgi:hypothetical protein
MIHRAAVLTICCVLLHSAGRLGGNTIACPHQRRTLIVANTPALTAWITALSLG